MKIASFTPSNSITLPTGVTTLEALGLIFGALRQELKPALMLMAQVYDCRTAPGLPDSTMKVARVEIGDSRTDTFATTR